jgi:hypothetical protein
MQTVHFFFIGSRKVLFIGLTNSYNGIEKINSRYLMLGTLVFLIAAAIIILLLSAITEIVNYLWAYLLIISVSLVAVICNSRQKKK